MSVKPFTAAPGRSAGEADPTLGAPPAPVTPLIRALRGGSGGLGVRGMPAARSDRQRQVADGHQLRTAVDLQLAVDAGQMLLDRAGGHEQFAGDLGVGAPVRREY